MPEFTQSWIFWFILGIIIGFVVGFLLAIIMAASGAASRIEERMEEDLIRKAAKREEAIAGCKPEIEIATQCNAEDD